MVRTPHNKLPQKPAPPPSRAGAPARQGPPTWLLIASVAGGVLVGGAVAWMALGSSGGPRRAADSATADDSTDTSLNSRTGRPPATSRFQPAFENATASNAAPQPAAASAPRTATRSVAAAGDDSGDEPADHVETDATNAAEDLRNKTDDEAAQRRRQAFGAFQSLGKSVSLPAVAAATSDIGATGGVVAGFAGPIGIDLGPFALTDLGEPRVRLAVPHDTIDGGKFKADIVRVEGQGVPKWQIRYLPAAVAVDGTIKPADPRPLAALVARDGRLVLEVARVNEVALPPFALLRRSVILVEAKDPAAPAAPAAVQEIRLVEPTKVGSLVIDVFADNPQQLKINPPPGIARTVAGPNRRFDLELPSASLRFEAVFPDGEAVNLELPADVTDATRPGVGSWTSLIAQLGPDLALHAGVELSLPRATLTVQTVFSCKNAAQFDKDKAREAFVEKPDQMLKKVQGAFRQRVKGGVAVPFAAIQTKAGDAKIDAWFRAPLASQRKGGMGMPMPGHETARESFELFLKDRGNWPNDWDSFVRRCRNASDQAEWENVYTQQINAWAEWFWPQFEKQWQANAKRFQGVLSERHEIRIIGITSLAYDERGKVYEVPLVTRDSTPQPATRTTVRPDADGIPGGDADRGGATHPPPAATGSGSVGID